MTPICQAFIYKDISYLQMEIGERLKEIRTSLNCSQKELSSHFWGYIDLSKLYQSNQVLFVILTSIMSIVTVLKAVLFYIIIKIFTDKKINLSNPFTQALGKYLYGITYCALGIGLFSKWGGDLLKWIANQNINMPLIENLKLAGADVWLLMGFVMLVFAIIFKKGIELQSENDLTV